MATRGMRHAVLWVSDPVASATFYEQALGLETKSTMGDAVFMSSPDSDTDHDLGLFKASGTNTGQQSADQLRGGQHGVGLYHIAWEVGTLADLVQAKEQLAEMGALVGENNHGVSRSLYCQDPDGIEFEVMWEVPLELFDADAPSNIALDLEGDIARWGADRASRGA